MGLVLLWFTLDYTRKATEHTGAMLEEAKKATRAAQETVTVTREIGEAQARAYLSIERAAAYIDLDISDGPAIEAGVTVRNHGQSPARHVHFAVEVACVVKTEEGWQQTVFVRTGTWGMEAITAGSAKDSGMIGFGTVHWPPNVMRDARGAPIVGSGTAGVFAVDVFGKGIFETRPLKVAMHKDQFHEWLATREFDRPMMPFPNEENRLLRAVGWTGPGLEDKKPKDWDEGA